MQNKRDTAVLADLGTWIKLEWKQTWCFTHTSLMTRIGSSLCPDVQTALCYFGLPKCPQISHGRLYYLAQGGGNPFHHRSESQASSLLIRCVIRLGSAYLEMTTHLFKLCQYHWSLISWQIGRFIYDRWSSVHDRLSEFKTSQCCFHSEKWRSWYSDQVGV